MSMILTGKCIKSARVKDGVSVEDFAKSLGIDTYRLSKIESEEAIASPNEMSLIEDELGLACIHTSFDSEDLIEDLEADIQEFGSGKECYLLYKVIEDKFVCFTDYQPITDEMPLMDSEIMPEEKVMTTTYAKALEWFRRQDSLL